MLITIISVRITTSSALFFNQNGQRLALHSWSGIRFNITRLGNGLSLSWGPPGWHAVCGQRGGKYRNRIIPGS